MAAVLKGIALVLEHIARWSGFRGAIALGVVVDVDVEKNCSKFKMI